ncbi:MAG: hypothetical protein KAR65_03830 [Anaerolineales bacterium]|nr:hypothetical protein [Anaerolineales bacterium]MCK5633709.1 hypothetical protein [Anaerolineales bacterium]
MNEEDTQANDELEITLEAPDVEAEKPVMDSEQEIVEDEGVPSEPVEPKRRLRRFLFWTLFVTGVFALGLVAMWFVRVRPLSTEFEKASIKVESLEFELEDLRPLRAENEQLLDELEMGESQLQLLDVLVNVTSAQLALAQEDEIAAKAALAGTKASLLELEEKLSAGDAETVRSLIDRLELVQGEVDTDEFAASRDLEILANNLLSLERSLYR